MEDDDDMIMIIVGEENQSLAMPIKQEPEDSIKEPDEELDESFLDINAILESAEMHGEYLDMSLIKEEYFDCEYLDVDLDNTKRTRKPRVPKPEVEIKQTKEEYSFQSDSNNGNNTKPTPKKLSYIAQLRKNFPKMRKDEKCIVAHLAEIMKHIKPPPPPRDFYEEVDGMFVCVYCNAESGTLAIASRHYQKKHGTRYLTCYACGVDYRCTTGLYKHEKRCPSPDARVVLKARGWYLGRKGRRRPYLTLNTFDPWDRQSKKNDKKRHFCSHCPASFCHKDTLLSHEYMHRGVRPYKCEKCPFAYTSAIALRRHIQKHLGAKFICDACGRSFSAKTTLIVHMNTHLPLRKYPCDRCERRFAQKSALRHHIDRDHLHIPPPFACAACPKRFPRISNLKAHMKAIHGMTLMTREMFIKALPTLKESDLKQATIVFNSFENKVVTAPLRESILNENGEDHETSLISQDTDEHIDSEPISKNSMKTVEFLPFSSKRISSSFFNTVKNEEEILGTPNNAVARKPHAENSQVKFIDRQGESDNTSNLDLSKAIDNARFIHTPVLETVIKNKPKTITLDDSEIEIKSSLEPENKPDTKSSIFDKTVDARQMEIKKVINEGLAKTRINLIRRAPIHTRSSVMKTRSGKIVNEIEQLRNNLIKECL